MLNYTVTNDKGQTTIILSGSLSIVNAAEIKEVFSSALIESSKIIVNHKEAEDFDITYIQLLIAAYKSALKENKMFAIDLSNQNTEFVDLINNLGLNTSVPEVKELLNMKLSEEIIG